ncbi:hypothetical protein E4U21_003091 [Claviceps maximensis]|nr:hypothetical protein E4U21_003091 [Claviceps maximensis]
MQCPTLDVKSAMKGQIQNNISTPEVCEDPLSLAVTPITQTGRRWIAVYCHPRQNKLPASEPPDVGGVKESMNSRRPQHHRHLSDIRDRISFRSRA